MNQKLKVILREATSIQAALLRFREADQQQSLQVKIAYCSGNNLYCIVAEEIPAELKMSNKPIHIIQKYHSEYLFISGHICDEVKKNPRILSVAVIKASWFVRKNKGSVSWLREKHTYENDEGLRYAS